MEGIIRERIIEIFYQNEWREIDFAMLKDGDIFRAFDNGIRYVDSMAGINVWKVVGMPYTNPGGFLTVDIVGVEDISEYIESVNNE